MKWFAISMLIVFSLASGCDVRKREEDFQRRETALNQKEQELLLKEKTLQIKEQELIKREQKIDSTLTKDTAGYNPAIIGTWSVKMTCTEATCAGSAVGDTKNEQWNISYEANTLIAKAMFNGKLVRTYTGLPKEDVIELVEEQQNAISQPTTTMVVRLRLTDATTMEGQREIIRENCKVIYALQMEKQQ